MDKILNWGIIIFGDIRIEGHVDFWEYMNNGSVNVVMDGTRYKVGANKILLMHKEDI